MNTTVSPSLTVESTQKEALKDLVTYCQEQSVYVSPLLAAKHDPGQGFGIYSAKPIKKGERLIHVPIGALLTTQSIPNHFLSKAERKKLTTHCLLAAYLAFGQDKDIAKYQRWVSTWPRLEDFTSSMPMFWSGGLHKSGPASTPTPTPDDRAVKRRRTINGVDGIPQTVPAATAMRPSFTLSPGIDVHWLTTPQQSTTSHSSGHLLQQIDKLRHCLSAIDRCFPHLKIYDFTSSSSYRKFLHMWACVNTRCFYYLRPGQSPPDDSNEAMALCPFQDLFNHSDATGCFVRFDKGGFYVRADKDYKAGEELFLNYGSHSNDMLWMEYGFTMTKNKEDHLKIDDIVLSTLDQTNTKLLERSGYHGNYTLKADGVCYRTVMTSYLGLLADDQWRRMINGGQLDPETNPTYRFVRLEAKRRVVDWILKVRTEAEWSLKALASKRSDEQLLREWVIGTTIARGQESEEAQIRLAEKRKELCITRWIQIFNMCMSAIREIERDCPGSFIDESKAGRYRKDLEHSAEGLLERIRS